MHEAQHISVLRCKLCKRKFKERTTLRQHMEKKHEIISEKAIENLIVTNEVKITDDLNQRSIEADVQIGEGDVEMSIKKKDFKQNDFTGNLEKSSLPNQENTLCCRFCDKPYNDSGMLKFHETIHIHNDDTPYACKDCDKKFPSEKTLKVHIGKCHPIFSQTDLDQMMEILTEENTSNNAVIFEKSDNLTGGKYCDTCITEKLFILSANPEESLNSKYPFLL